MLSPPNRPRKEIWKSWTSTDGRFLVEIRLGGFLCVPVGCSYVFIYISCLIRSRPRPNLETVPWETEQAENPRACALSARNPRINNIASAAPSTHRARSGRAVDVSSYTDAFRSEQRTRSRTYLLSSPGHPRIERGWTRTTKLSRL